MTSMDAFFEKQRLMKAAAAAKAIAEKDAPSQPSPEPKKETPSKPSTNPLMALHKQSVAVTAAAPVADKLEPEIQPLDFKSRLAKLDEMIKSELGITDANFDIIRGHVQKLMIQLREEPALDAILIDRDVHNILHFIRHVRIDAAAALADKGEKAEKKTARSGKVTKAASKIAAAFGSMDMTALGKFK